MKFANGSEIKDIPSKEKIKGVPNIFVEQFLYGKRATPLDRFLFHFAISNPPELFLDTPQAQHLINFLNESVEAPLKNLIKELELK